MANINDRVCIVGAGPAGLTAAMYLEKKGYKNITIYEKSERVGGKCYSPEYKGKRNGSDDGLPYLLYYS